MPLVPGTRLGAYEVVALVGNNGAGEIYKASDTQQSRNVTIKLLPPHFSKDPQLKERFERESKTLSGLNHPNISAVHEVVRDSETDFLVTEFVEGDTLAKRLEKGALPLDEALRAALAIADALNNAHRGGIVHGGLNPSNIVLTPDGVKLLDFGLTKWEEKGDIPDDALQYMAPEQINKGETDARSDIFAFGAVVYEMVTGGKAFEGKNRPVLIAAISTLDPDPVSKLQPDSPPAFDHVVERALAKNPDDRWQTSHDLSIQLRWVAEGGDVLLAAARARQKRERLVLAVLAAVVFAVTVAATRAYVSLGEKSGNEAFQFRVPVAGLNTSDIAISPDGTTLAFVAKPNTSESASLFVRPAGSPEFRKLVGTDDASQPFWSPDSRSIGFTAGGRLKRVAAAGGAPKDLGEAPGFTGGSWGSAGVIVFGSAKGLYRVSAEGGKPEAITTVEKSEAGHFWPAFLPDGQNYLFLAWSADAANRAVFSGALGSKEKNKLMAAATNVEYADPGYILFHREATLFAQAFDPKGIQLSGEPLHIADQVGFSPTNGRGYFDVSQKGALVYFQDQGGSGGSTGRGQMATNYQWGWRDRTGRQISLAGDQGTFGDMDLSPDGKLIAVTQPDAGASGADIWVIDWQAAGRAQRVSLDPGDDINPVWERPSGDRIAFTTYRKGNADIYIKNANGTGPETPLLDTANNESIEDWSKDGKHIAYKQGQENSEDIWILPTTGEKKPFPIVQGPYHKDEAQFSYDGHWLAYTSDESGGVFQVFVVSFPGGEQKLQVSKDGGGQPRWKDDGKELYFRSPDNGVMAVKISPGPKLSAGIPEQLFTGVNSANSRDPVRHQWAVTPSGQQFLLRVPAGQAAPTRGGTGAIVVSAVPQVVQGRGGQATAANGGGQGFVSSGLTVIRNWPAAFGKVAP